MIVSTAIEAIDRQYKAHLDGYNLLLSFAGEPDDWPRSELIYWTDDRSVAALRYEQYKVTFFEQNAHGLDVWLSPFEVLRATMLSNLRSDPFERAEEENAMGYQRWLLEHILAIAPAGA